MVDMKGLVHFFLASVQTCFRICNSFRGHSYQMRLTNAQGLVVYEPSMDIADDIIMSQWDGRIHLLPGCLLTLTRLDEGYHAFIMF